MKIALEVGRFYAVAATVLAAVSTVAFGQTATSTIELPAGGLVFAHRDRLVVEQETLTIGLDRVEIDYTVRSNDRAARSVAFAFPMPVIDMAALSGADVAIPAYDPTNPTNFVGFWTTIDGKPVEPEVDVRALVLGHIDVTPELNKLGIPLYPFAPDLPEKLSDLTQEQKTALVDANVAQFEDTALEPLWVLRSVFHWRHVIASDTNVAIRHHYKPVVGSAPWSAELATVAKTKYCLSDTDIAVLDKRAADGKVPTIYWVSYVPGVNSWMKGPSSLFKLVIEKPEETSIVSTCVGAAAQKREGSTLHISETGRIDDSDIEVLFVE